MWQLAVRAVFYSRFCHSKIPATFIAQCIQRAVAEQTVELLFIRIMTWKILALRIAEIGKSLVSPFPAGCVLPFRHTSSPPGQGCSVVCIACNEARVPFENKKPPTPAGVSGSNVAIQAKTPIKTAIPSHLPKGTRFILTDMAGFLAYDLPAGPEKERLLRARPQWQIALFIVNHSDGCHVGFSPMLPNSPMSP